MSATQCTVHDAVTGSGSIDDENSKEPDKKVKSRRPASTLETQLLKEHMQTDRLLANAVSGIQILPSGSKG